MSTRSVRSAIDAALTTPRGRAQVSGAEAKKIIAAAKTEARGAPVISKAEAELFKKLASESTFDRAGTKYTLTTPAKRELEAFFQAFDLPYGSNEQVLRSKIESLTPSLPEKPCAQPNLTNLVPFTLKDGRPYDGALSEAFIDPNTHQFFLKSSVHNRANPQGATSWGGPYSLKGAAPTTPTTPTTPTSPASLDSIKTAITAASTGILFMSESDYPFDTVAFPGKGATKPTAAEFRATAGLPAGTKVEVRSYDAFMKNLTEPKDWWEDYNREQGKQYEKLDAALKANLTDLQVFRTGDIQIGVWIVGRDQNGNLVGTHTTSIET